MQTFLKLSLTSRTTDNDHGDSITIDFGVDLVIDYAVITITMRTLKVNLEGLTLTLKDNEAKSSTFVGLHIKRQSVLTFKN